MKNAVRPFVPGPWVIVDDAMKAREVVAPGVERGPLTDAEKRQFLPPRRSIAVRSEIAAARNRAARYAEEFRCDRPGAYTPPRGWKSGRRQGRTGGYSIADLRRAA